METSKETSSELQDTQTSQHDKLSALYDALIGQLTCRPFQTVGWNAGSHPRAQQFLTRIGLGVADDMLVQSFVIDFGASDSEALRQEISRFNLLAIPTAPLARLHERVLRGSPTTGRGQPGPDAQSDKMERFALDLYQRHFPVDIPDLDAVFDYIRLFPDLMGLLTEITQQLSEQIGAPKRFELSIDYELYAEPTLLLLARQEKYQADLNKRLQETKKAFLEQIAASGGRLHISTDFVVFEG